MATYSQIGNNPFIISLEAFDIESLPTHSKPKTDDDLMPIWSKNNLNIRNEDMYYEFEVLTKEQDLDAGDLDTTDELSSLDSDDDDDFPSIEYMCQICNLTVPETYRDEHNSSIKHVSYLKLARTALARITNFLNEESKQKKPNYNQKSYFCKQCVTIIMKKDRETHEKTIKHINSIKNDEVLRDLVKIYVDGFKDNVATERDIAKKVETVNKVVGVKTSKLKNSEGNVVEKPKSVNIVKGNVDKSTKNPAAKTVVNHRTETLPSSKQAKEINSFAKSSTELDKEETQALNIHYEMEATNNPKELKCKICNNYIPNNIKNVTQHVESMKHISKLSSKFVSNKTEDKYYCDVCRIYVAKTHVFDHNNNINHISLLNTDRNVGNTDNVKIRYVQNGGVKQIFQNTKENNQQNYPMKDKMEPNKIKKLKYDNTQIKNKSKQKISENDKKHNISATNDIQSITETVDNKTTLEEESVTKHQDNSQEEKPRVKEELIKEIKKDELDQNIKHVQNYNMGKDRTTEKTLNNTYKDIYIQKIQENYQQNNQTKQKFELKENIQGNETKVEEELTQEIADNDHTHKLMTKSFKETKSLKDGIMDQETSVKQNNVTKQKFELKGNLQDNETKVEKELTQEIADNDHTHKLRTKSFKETKSLKDGIMDQETSVKKVTQDEQLTNVQKDKSKAKIKESTPINEQKCSQEQDKSLTKLAKSRVLCEICNIQILKNDLIPHINGTKHAKALKNINLNTKETHYLMKKTKNSHIFTCKVCECSVPNKTKDINIHLCSIKHKTNYETLLKMNSLKKDNNNFLCSLCNTQVLKTTELDHIKSTNHVAEMSKTENYSKINKTQSNKELSTSRTQNNNKYFECGTCAVIIPVESGNTITEHNKSAEHRLLFLTRKFSSNYNKNVCCHCGIITYNVFEHICYKTDYESNIELEIRSLREYIEFINNHIPPVNNLNVISNDFIEIKFENVFEDTVLHYTIKTVEVKFDHFFGYAKVIWANKVVLMCKVCDVIVRDDITLHKFTIKHIKGIMRPLSDQNCIRQLDGKWSHCILCNERYKNTDVVNHIKYDTDHHQRLSDALVPALF